MSKNKPKNRRKVPFGDEPVSSHSDSTKAKPDSYRRYLMVIFVAIVLGGGFLAVSITRNYMFAQLPRWGYEKINAFEHDKSAFTQGLVVDSTGKFFYESTGMLGKSTFRKVEIETGKVVQSLSLPDDCFGEGLVQLNDKFYQLTWKNDKIFVYDQDMKLIETKEFDGEMWGLATDGTYLIMSNGSSRLNFLNPETMKVEKFLFATVAGQWVMGLNELEYYNGDLYANRYQTDLIYKINPATGKVTAIIDLHGLWPDKDRPDGGNSNGIVMNGIAVDPTQGRIFVTGKLCPFVYEIKFKLRD